MKLGLIMLMSLCLVFVACERRTPDTTQAAGETERSFEAERDHYVETVEARLEAAGKQLDSLEDLGADMEGAEKTNFDRRIESLHQEHEMVENKLNDIRDVSDSSWTNLRIGVDSDLAKFEQKVEDLESEVTTRTR